MGLEQKNVDEVVNDAVKGAFNIPEFQRGFVWRPDQVRDLLESLYRDYPVGSMLVWDASDYASPRSAEGAQTNKWIVDGQQRTTALCVAFGSKPYWWPSAASWNDLVEKVDVLVNLEMNDGQPEFALANPIRLRNVNWISVRRILRCKSEDDIDNLVSAIADERGLTPRTGADNLNNRMIRRLWNIRGRLIPLVSIQHEIEDVAEIFARLNQAGTRVTEADVIVALVAASNSDWVREDFLSYANDLKDSGFDLDPGVYIRTITGISRGTARLKDVSKDFWRDDVRIVWKQVKASINQVLRLLQDRGVLSAEILPSRNSLIPLFTFHARFGNEPSFDRAFAWFLLANADGRYSGSSSTTLSQDLATIHNASGGLAALDELASRLRVTSDFKADRFLEDYSRDRFGRLLLYLLIFDREATDWISKVRIGFDKGATSLNEGFLPEWHHIFPRAVLKKAGYDENLGNYLANITVLNEATNRNKIRAKTPELYVQQYDIGNDSLERHLIPHEAPLAVGAYDDFVISRAEQLADAATAYFRRLSRD